jgi:hypothetical protein
MIRISDLMGSVGAVRRKLRALAAVIEDPGATEHERATAAALKARLEQRLRKAGVPNGDWTDVAFWLGRRAKQTSKLTSLASEKGDWTENAYRLGKALRRGYKRWSS